MGKTSHHAQRHTPDLAVKSRPAQSREGMVRLRDQDEAPLIGVSTGRGPSPECVTPAGIHASLIRSFSRALGGLS